MICHYCGEEMKPFEHSKSPGICRDCYAYCDMDRFIPVDGTPQAKISDKKCNYRVFDHESGEWRPLRRTTPSSDRQMLADWAWGGILGWLDGPMLAVPDKNKQEPAPPSPQSSADTEDKKNSPD